MEQSQTKSLSTLNWKQIPSINNLSWKLKRSVKKLELCWMKMKMANFLASFVLVLAIFAQFHQIISAQTFNVINYGAVGNGATEDTQVNMNFSLSSSLSLSFSLSILIWIYIILNRRFLMLGKLLANRIHLLLRRWWFPAASHFCFSLSLLMAAVASLQILELWFGFFVSIYELNIIVIIRYDLIFVNYYIS